MKFRQAMQFSKEIRDGRVKVPRKKATPLNGRTMDLLKGFGYTCMVVEQTIPRTFIKRDLFHFIDIIAIREKDRAIVGVQSTDYSDHARRRTKIEQEPLADLWKRCGGQILIVSWGKRKRKTDDRMVWIPRLQWLTPEPEEIANAH